MPRFGCPDCGYTSANQSGRAYTSGWGYFDNHGDWMEEDMEIQEVEYDGDYHCPECGHSYNSPEECCDHCEHPLEDCDCERCDHCDDRVEDCGCEQCDYCSEHIDDCACERCNICEDVEGDCTCHQDNEEDRANALYDAAKMRRVPVKKKSSVLAVNPMVKFINERAIAERK